MLNLVDKNQYLRMRIIKKIMILLQLPIGMVILLAAVMLNVVIVNGQKKTKFPYSKTHSCQDKFLRRFKSSEYCNIVEDCKTTALRLASIKCKNGEVTTSQVKTICNDVNWCLVTESRDLCCYFFPCGDICIQSLMRLMYFMNFKTSLPCNY